MKYENRCSVFVGVCKSQELFEQYWEKDYELLWDDFQNTDFPYL